MKKYILSIDQGTTSTRAVLINQEGIACFKAQREVECLYPKPGWVEQDALGLWVSVIDVVNEVLIKSNLSMANIEAIGVTNQRETAIVWDKETGLPIYPAVVWQSRQSVEICNDLEDKKTFIHQKTGLLLNPYFSASKIRFILDAVPGAQARAEKGELMFGTVDTWLIYKMTNGQVHATDVSNASRTLLYNIFDLRWDDELLSLFNIPKVMLPSVHPSSFRYGAAEFFSPRVPITGVAGDQQAALFGQACFAKGDSKNTYGTGCFMLMNTGDRPILSKNGLLTTIAWQIGDQVSYALEGSVFVGGAAVQWIRDQMKLIKDAADSERSAKMVNDSEGVYFVPAFVGLGTPYWDNKARGAVFGLTRGTSKYHFVRATLESIAYQSKDVIEVMKKESGLAIKVLKVDGGATANNYLMQFQSDILGAEIKIPQCLETTSLGAAYLAGLGCGYWSCLSTIEKIQHFQKEFKPQMATKEVKKRYKGWKLAVKATRIFK